MRNKAISGAPKTPSYTRIMLLVDPPTASFLDQLALELSQPGRPANRQDVIRHTLARLQMNLDAEGRRRKTTKRSTR